MMYMKFHGQELENLTKIFDWTSESSKNSNGWNNYWRSEFRQTISESTLNGLGFSSLHGEDAKAAAVKFLYSGSLGDYKAIP